MSDIASMTGVADGEGPDGVFDLAFTDDQQQIVEAASRFFAGLRSEGRPGETVLRRLAPDRWAELAGLGWLGIGVAEENGGAGLTLVEECLVLREAGRHLLSPSMLASVLAARCAEQAANSALLARLVSGETRAALAIPTAKGDTSQYYLVDAAPQDHLFAWDGMALYDRDAFAEPTAALSADPTIGIDRVGRAPQSTPLIASDRSELRLVASLLASAMLAGIAEAARDAAISYASVRKQFGKQIGAFQSIKHICVDMAVRAEALWSQTLYAAHSAAAGHAASGIEAQAAALLGGRYALQNARANIQIHGAMGFTAECDAHLFLKRAHMLRLLVDAHGAAGAAQPNQNDR